MENHVYALNKKVKVDKSRCACFTFPVLAHVSGTKTFWGKHYILFCLPKLAWHLVCGELSCTIMHYSVVQSAGCLNSSFVLTAKRTIESYIAFVLRSRKFRLPSQKFQLECPLIFDFLLGKSKILPSLLSKMAALNENTKQSTHPSLFFFCKQWNLRERTKQSTFCIFVFPLASCFCGGRKDTCCSLLLKRRPCYFQLSDFLQWM